MKQVKLGVIPQTNQTNKPTWWAFLALFNSVGSYEVTMDVSDFGYNISTEVEDNITDSEVKTEVQKLINNLISIKEISSFEITKIRISIDPQDFLIVYLTFLDGSIGEARAMPDKFVMIEGLRDIFSAIFGCELTAKNKKKVQSELMIRVKAPSLPKL